MSAFILEPMLSSVANVLSTMAMLEVTPGEAELKEIPEAKGDVTGLISMRGESSRGSMALSFKEAVILDIAERMLGERIATINEEITDLVGEITNMACGGAKAQLYENGFDFELATPIVITGKSHQIIHQVKGPKILMPIVVESGEFYIEICFETLQP